MNKRQRKKQNKKVWTDFMELAEQVLARSKGILTLASEDEVVSAELRESVIRMLETGGIETPVQKGKWDVTTR